MAKAKKEAEEVMFTDNGGALPGEHEATAPAKTAPARTKRDVPEDELSFDAVPGRFPYQYFAFDADGATFTGRYVRCWAKGEVPDGGEQPLKYTGIEFLKYGTDERVIVAGNDELWRKFNDEIEPTRGAEGVEADGKWAGRYLDRTTSVWRITRTEKKDLGEGRSVVNFAFAEARFPQLANQ